LVVGGTCHNFWTRAQQLRELARYFRSIGVVDQGVGQLAQAMTAYVVAAVRLARG